mmetsp:Transcript_4832/g.11075  ORF Transcript_4832/g.11075 Transcript_4832/m.11075 type:complete len:225 (+) Transcript_4832:56-730(+)
MAPKLPNHLASLLRHQPAASPVAASSAAKTSQDGKAARKKAARVKRRAKAKEDRAADRAERVEKKKQLQEVEVKADPPESTIAKKKKKLVPKKKRAAVAKREGEENKAPKPTGPKASAASAASPFDPAAAADEALLLDLEKKLGIAGDSKRQRKEEKQIFADLFEAEDLGIEQLPSSDEDETKAGLEALKDEDMVGLLDSILGGKTASKGPNKAKVSKKKSKAK